MARRYGKAAGLRVWPRQYASSCFKRADGEVKAAAIASMAGTVCGTGGFSHAICFRANRARKRRANGVVSDVRTLRSAESSSLSGLPFGTIT